MKVTKKQNMLNEEIRILHKELRKHKPESDEYRRIAQNLKTLYDIKALKKPFGVSADKWAMIGANLLGIGMIIHAEETKVITSKALAFVIKGRV